MSSVVNSLIYSAAQYSFFSSALSQTASHVQDKSNEMIYQGEMAADSEEDKSSQNMVYIMRQASRVCGLMGTSYLVQAAAARVGYSVGFAPFALLAVPYLLEASRSFIASCASPRVLCLADSISRNAGRLITVASLVSSATLIVLGTPLFSPTGFVFLGSVLSMIKDTNSKPRPVVETQNRDPQVFCEARNFENQCREKVLAKREGILAKYPEMPQDIREDFQVFSGRAAQREGELARAFYLYHHGLDPKLNLVAWNS